MSNTITLSEPTVNTLISTWTGLQLERGPNANNLAAFTVVAQIPYVAMQTSYTFVDSTGASSDWYRVVRYGPGPTFGTYSPAWPVTVPAITGGNGARRSLKYARRLLARRLGSLQVITATEDGATDGTSIRSTGLATLVDPKRYSGWWSMPTDGVSMGEIRRIPDGALNAADGTLSISPAFVARIVQGTQVEMHKLLPPDELDGLLGLRQALNMALGECWFIDRLALPGLADTVTYDASSLGDWLDPDAISEYYGPILNGGFPALPWGGFNARRDAETLQIDVAPGVSAGADMRIETTRPADTLIRVNGTWADSTEGFTNDDDESLIQPQFLVEVALVHCFEALAAATTGATMLRWAKKAEDQKIKVALAKFRGLPHPPERSDHSAAAYAGANDWIGWIR